MAAEDGGLCVMFIGPPSPMFLEQKHVYQIVVILSL